MENSNNSNTNFVSPTTTDSVQSIKDALNQIAFKKSTPFCHGCYIMVPSGICSKCFSDDLMLSYKNCGFEWGPEWVTQEILREHATEVNTLEAFEQSVSECYPERTQIGWLQYDTITALKELDPVSWKMAYGEWLDSEISDDNLITFDHGSTHYWVSEIEQIIKELDADAE